MIFRVLFMFFVMTLVGQKAQAIDFSVRVLLPKYKASILISKKGVCSWEKKGMLTIDLKKNCRVRPYQETIAIELDGIQIDDYKVEIIQSNKGEKQDYELSVFVDSDIKLVGQTPPQGYIHQDMNKPVEIAVRFMGMDKIKKKSLRVLAIESTKDFVSPPKKMQAIGAGWYTVMLKPDPSCGNHTFLVKATGRLRSGKKFVRTHPFYVDIGDPKCRVSARKEFSTLTIRFANQSSKLNDNSFDEASNMLETIQARVEQFMNGQPHVAIVAGFASQESESSTHAKSNLRLSKKRAKAVTKALKKMKLESLRGIHRCVAYGHTAPVEANTSLEGRAANRRVEVVLIPLGAAVPENIWSGVGEECF